MDVHLLSTPGWVHDAPPAALPLLFASLKQHGLNAAQHDLDIDFLYAILRNKDMLCELLHGLQQEHHHRSFRTRRDVHSLEVEFILSGKMLKALRDCSPASPAQPDINRYFQLMRARRVLLVALQRKYGELAPLFFGHKIKGKALGSLNECHKAQDSLFVREMLAPYLERRLSQKRTARLMGFSVSSPAQLVSAMAAARILKKRNPSQKLVVGGPLLSLSFNESHLFEALTPFFDFIVISEGERALCLLADDLERHDRWKKIPNLFYKQGERYRYSGSCHVEDLDGLPIPNFDGLPLDRYLSPERILPITISRSCPHRCSFCGYNRNVFGDWRVLSAERAVTIIHRLKKQYDGSIFPLMTSCLSPQFANKLSEGLLQKKEDVKWYAPARFQPRFLRDGLLARMAEAGCFHLGFGLESASPHVLERMHKDIDITIASRILRRCKEVGIMTSMFIIVGFPGETKRDLQKTLRFMKEHRNDAACAHLNWYTLEPQSPVWQHPERFGVKMKPRMNETIRFDFSYGEYSISHATPRRLRAKQQLMRKFFVEMESLGLRCDEDLFMSWHALPVDNGWISFAHQHDKILSPERRKISEGAIVRLQQERMKVIKQKSTIRLHQKDNFATITLDERTYHAVKLSEKPVAFSKMLKEAYETFAFLPTDFKTTVEILAAYGFIEIT